MSSQKMSFSVGADFLNNRIAAFVNDGDIVTAFQTALKCVNGLDVDGQTKIGIASDIVDGHMTMKDTDDGAYEVVKTNESRTFTIIQRLQKLENLVAEKDKEISRLTKQLLYVYDYLEAEYPYAFEKVTNEENRDENGDYAPDVVEDVDMPIMGSYNGMLDNALNEFLEVSHADEEPAYGWLSPEGEFHEAPWGDHGKWAWDYVEENEIESIDGVSDCGDLLVELGWILVHNPMHGVGRATMSGKNKPSMGQKKWLAEYFTKWNRPEAASAIKEGWQHELPQCFDII